MTHFDAYREYWNTHARNVGPQKAVTGLGDDYDKTIRPVLKRIAPEKVTSVIDLGCGAGLCYPIVRSLWPDVFYLGMDISSEMIAYCQRTYDGASWSWMADNSIPNGADFIICHSVMTHIFPEDAREYLRGIALALNKGGTASVSIHVSLCDEWQGTIERIDYNPEYFERMIADANLRIFNRIEGRQLVYGVRA